MHDYKSRQSDLSFSKPKGAWRKGLRRTVGFALTAGILYGVVQLALSWQGDPEASKTDPNVIELPLPPHAEAGEQAQTTPATSGPLAEAATNGH